MVKFRFCYATVSASIVEMSETRCETQDPHFVDNSWDFFFADNYFGDFILNRETGDKEKPQEFKPPSWEFTCMVLIKRLCKNHQKN